MAVQITLSDDDYAALQAAAAKSGKPINDLVHEAIVRQYTSSTAVQFKGIYSYPTDEPDTPEEEAEDEELAALLGSNHPWLSEMIIEDRGPR